MVAGSDISRSSYFGAEVMFDRDVYEVVEEYAICSQWKRTWT